MNTRSSPYFINRLNQWLNNADPQLIDAYSLPIQIKLDEIDKNEINIIRSLFNRIYEYAREFDIRIVFANLRDKLHTLSHKNCNHLMESCRAVTSIGEDLLQKFKAIESQTLGFKSAKLEIIIE